MNTGVWHNRWFLLLAVMCAASACRQKKAYFAELLPAQTGIAFRNDVADTDSFDIFDYPYLYAGAGVSVGDINGDGLDDVFLVGNRKGSNRLYLNKGGFKFEDITATAGVAGLSDWCTGSTMADINGDGLLDIYVSTVTIPGKLKSRNELYLNEGKGRFREAAKEFGLALSCHSTQSAFFDYDRDGDLDCFVLNHGVTYTDDYQSVAVRKRVDPTSGGKLLRNDGPPQTPPVEGLSTAQPSLKQDANNRAVPSQSGVRVVGHSPTGGAGGGFTEVTQQAGIYCASNEYGLGIAIGDLNNDGWPDIYVGNDFKENDFCYINNGNGTFTESTENLFDHVSRFSMGNDMADYNNDGWLDVLTLDMLSQDEKVLKTSLADDDIEIYNYKQKNFGFYYQFSKNCLQQNVAGKHFTDVALQNGIAATDWSWAPLMADFNNDGRKDLFVSNGFRYRTNDLDFTVFSQAALMKRQQVPTSHVSLIRHLPSGEVPDYFYLGSDAGFSDESAAAGFTTPTLSNGTAYADLDNDGDLDLVVNRINSEAGIYRNDFPRGNYLSLALNGSGENRFGIGAVVYAYSGDSLQCIHQSPVRGFMSSVSPVLHLGLGKAETLDSLFICWPDGSGQRLLDVNANQRLTLRQSDAKPGIVRPGLPQVVSSQWDKALNNDGIDFIHQEDDFDDLNVQPLLPHSISTQGPKMATGDVNGDGREDFFVCGAKGQSGALYLQTGDGKFTRSLQPSIATDSLHEGADAVFFDADGDKDLDLYVASGGNEFFGRQEALKDCLYTNDGKGHFTRSTSLPDLFENKSCVRPCDFDEDGDIDLFIGGRANARMYGYLPASVVLENDGKGVFKEVTEQRSKGLINAGMVTDACWSDVDGDGWMDLLVIGEWMPVTLFKNNKGHLEKASSLPAINGLWQTILPADVDGDGDVDYLLGNWGTNNKFTASEKYPLKLFIADWDNNGEREPILATAKEGKYYAFYGKADLEKRLPSLRKKFLKAADFAGKTIDEIFGEEAVQKAQVLEASVLESCMLHNEGGGFSLQALPAFAQAAPIFSFVQTGRPGEQPSFIAAGNFYEVSPYEGRYDAQMPVRFSFRNGKAVLQDCLLQGGPVRQLKTIQTGNQQSLLVAVNNGNLTLYQQTKK